MTKEHPIISIIVPIFNSEGYLSKFIDSVLNQSFTNFELILINDGSTDSSGKICDEYSRADNRIIVIHKANGGVSSARNIGLSTAKGKWLYFCDSDDRLLSNCLANLIKQTYNNNIILVEGDYKVTNNNIEISNRKDSDRIITRNEYLMLLFKPSDGRYHGYLWTKLFNTALVRKYGLNFDEKIFYNEDRLFVFSYLCCIEGTISIIAKPVYNYFIRATGAMQSIKNQRYKLFQTDLDACIKIYNQSILLGNKPLSKAIKYEVYISYKTNVNLAKQYSDSPKEDIGYLDNVINRIYSKREKIEYSLHYQLGQYKHFIKNLIYEKKV